MLAAVADGTFASVEEAAARIVKVVETVEPDPEIAEKYETNTVSIVIFISPSIIKQISKDSW